jgi:hypothetical protein
MKNIFLVVAAMAGSYQGFAQTVPLAPAQTVPPIANYAALKVPAPMPALTVPLPMLMTVAVPLPAQTPDFTEDPTDYIGQEDQTLNKTFSKTFSADQSDKISVNNQFGSITIKTWDRKEAKAEVTITAYSSDNSEAQKLLDGVSIEAGKQGDQIAFKTQIASTRNNWGSGTRNGKKWRREVRVNYVVYVPASNALTLSQQYGNVTMPGFSGPVSAKVQYGNFSAEKLSNSSNYISVQYGNMNIEDLKNGTLKQQYGNGITLGTANDIKVNAQYSNVSIERLTGDATMSVQYNKVRIGQISEGSKTLNISAQYAGVDLGFNDAYKGKLDVQTSYGNFKYGSNVSARTDDEDDDRHVSFSKSYSGTIGGSGGSSQVIIKSSYGSINFR